MRFILHYKGERTMTSDIKDIQSVVTLKPEQELAIEHGEGNILISASAGSGKTFVMIERLIRLIKQKKAKCLAFLLFLFYGMKKLKNSANICKKVFTNGAFCSKIIGNNKII